MELQQAFGHALRRQRKARSLSQEDFTRVSSRTYLSELERGLKNPSLGKVGELAETMGVHPLTLLVECFALKDETDTQKLFDTVIEELATMKDT
ncbi:MAG: helix-turn-helix domain-containing protein [Marinobacter sp. T13-3]|nr:MAG: helix-turn-helix domain-containing protein [Marinobacter sp. T13-3]